jgi:putative endonuclease
MRGRNRKFGFWGETIAADFLRRRRFELLGRNFRQTCGEIDIIARKDGVLHFVEVKTRTERSSAAFGPPVEAVSRHKQQRLLRTAHAYLAEIGDDGKTTWQFDVISIVYSPAEKKADICLIANAFDGSLL